MLNPRINILHQEYYYYNIKMRNLIKSVRSVRPTNFLNPIPLFLFSSQLKFPQSQYASPLFLKANKFYFGGSQNKTDHQNVSKGQYTGPGFYMEQLLTGCLAIYSYYIESGNQAFLIDPLNETQSYQEILKKRGKNLKGVFLTHYHADYIAGHVELKKKYPDCELYIGPKGLETHGIKVLKDGQQIKVGDVKLKVIHTPGHTEESSCMLLLDSNNKEQCLFTGDTIFLNQVGRPDLAVKTNLSSQDLAKMLFDSLQKVKKLKDDVRVYPGHGAGSSCGKNIGKGDFCTLGTQKQNNYGLKETNKQKFVHDVLQGMPNPPQYFGYNAGVNKFQPFDYDEAHSNVNKKLSSKEVKQLISKQKATIVDIRGKDDLRKHMIKGALTIDFDGAFANWAGTLLKPKQKFVIFACSQQKAKQSIKRLLRIGYVNILGYCVDSVTDFETFTPDFVSTIPVPNHITLDVRNPPQWQKGVVDGQVTKLSLTNLFQDHAKSLSKANKYVIHCQGGYRARIAYSFLKNQGYDVKVLADYGYGQFDKMGIKTVRN